MPAKATINPLVQNSSEKPAYKLIGQNYTTPDLVAKVTGRAKYAEDYRAEGMLFAKLLLSPVPHAHVRSTRHAGREGDPHGGRSSCARRRDDGSGPGDSSQQVG
jgi:hypothetical protein